MRKIRKRLLRRFSGIKIPAKSAICAVLDRHALVERRGRVRRRAQGTLLIPGSNSQWCTDYKGGFLLGNRQNCYPLTVTDHPSRFLLAFSVLVMPTCWGVGPHVGIGGNSHFEKCCHHFVRGAFARTHRGVCVWVSWIIFGIIVPGHRLQFCSCI